MESIYFFFFFPLKRDINFGIFFTAVSRAALLATTAHRIDQHIFELGVEAKTSKSTGFFVIKYCNLILDQTVMERSIIRRIESWLIGVLLYRTANVL